MVVINNPDQHKFLMFHESGTKNKKYDAVLMHKKTKKLKLVPFGDVRYEHYKDSTGLGLYSHLDHLDKSRRKMYKIRHEQTRKNKFSSSWFADKYLW
jgi:hypothetical protein